MLGPATRWSLMGLLLVLLILVPFALFEESFLAVTKHWLGSGTGRFAVAAAVPLLLGLDVVLPVPSSVVATASGTVLGLGPGAGVAWLGLQLGAATGYLLGRRLGMPAARRFVGPAELSRAARSHRRWGAMSLVACRAVPVLAEGSVIVAGAVRMPFRRFSWLTGLANAAVAVVYASVGAFAVEVDAFLLAFAASLALPALVVGLYRVAERSDSGHPAFPKAGPRSEDAGAQQ